MKFLRFSIFAIAVLGMVGLFSCGGGGDDPQPSNADNISGTWAITGGGKAEKNTTDISGATASLTLTATSATELTYDLSTGTVPTFNGAAGSDNGTFSLNTAGTQATAGSATITIVSSIASVANGGDLVLRYAIPSAVSTTTEFKTFDTITLTLKKQ